MSQLHPVKKNFDAIHKAPKPKNVSELHYFIGLLCYYNKFLSNLSTVMAPLYVLLRKDTHFLLYYRSTPQSTTGDSPSMLMLNHQIRTRVDIMLPHKHNNVLVKQQNMITGGREVITIIALYVMLLVHCNCLFTP